MRTRWKIVGGSGIASIWIVAILIGQTGKVSGDTSSSTSTPTTTPTAVDPASAQDPNQPYPLGPGAIAYESLSAADKAAVDHVQENVDTSQPPSSYAAFATATAWTADRVQVEVAARQLGLTGTEQDGVIP